MLHGDAHHTHRAHGHLPRRANVEWTTHADGPIEGQVVASRDGTTLYVATLGGTLWALDRQGHERFHTALGARAYGTPCIGDAGTIYLGNDGGAFQALDPKDGHVVWRLVTPADADTGAVVTSRGLVVFAAGADVYGVRDGGGIAFRFHAGKKVFTSPALLHREAPLGDLIVFGSQDHHVYGLGPGGALEWKTDLGNDVDGSPAISDDGDIYVGTDGDVVVHLDAHGKVLRRTEVGGMVRGALSVARNGDALAGVFGPSPRMARISPAGILLGAQVTRGHGTRETGVLGGALEDDEGWLAFGGEDGLVHVVNAAGELVWTYDARSDVDAPLTLMSDGALIVATYDGDVISLR
jgi:outer membrane protein assembly factor BamB